MASEVKVEVAWGASSVKAGLKEMRDDFKKTREEFQEGFSVTKLLAVGAAFEFIKGGIESMMEEAGQLSDLSARFGVSASSIQRIGNAAKEDGVALEGIAGSMNKLIINQAKAKQGNEEMQKAITDLGMSVEDYINLDPEEAFYKVADAVKASEDPMIAYNSVVTLLGKSAGALIPTLQKGGDEIRKIGNAAGVMSDETIGNLDAAADKWEATMHQIKVWVAESFLWIANAAKTVGAAIGAAINELNPNVAAGEANRIFEEQYKEIWNPEKDEKKKGPVRDVEEGKEMQAAREKEKKDLEEVAKLHDKIHEQQREAWREAVTAELRINDLISEREELYAAANGVHAQDAKQQAEDWLKAGELEKRILAEREKVDKEQEQKDEKKKKAEEKYYDKVIENSMSRMTTEEQLTALAQKKAELEKEMAGLNLDDVGSEKYYDLLTQLEEVRDKSLKLATPKDSKDTERLVTSSLGRLSGGGAYLSKADPAVQTTEAVKKGNELLQKANEALRKIEEKVGRPTWQP